MSFYRYVLKCCSREEPLSWCKIQCSWVKNFEKFAEHNCGKESSWCNQLHYYLKAQYPNKIPISEGEAQELLNPFDAIITLDMMDEGLILLHMKYGFPFNMLPYMVSNSNLDVPMPAIDPKFKQKIMTHTMQPDVLIYRLAKERLIKQISDLPKDIFDSLLSKLKELNKKVTQICKYRRNNCLTTDPGVVSSSSCYYECIDAVVTGSTTYPSVDACSTCVYGAFKRGCEKCSCYDKLKSSNDPLAAEMQPGTAYCESIKTLECETSPPGHPLLAKVQCID